MPCSASPCCHVGIQAQSCTFGAGTSLLWAPPGWHHAFGFPSILHWDIRAEAGVPCCNKACYESSSGLLSRLLLRQRGAPCVPWAAFLSCHLLAHRIACALWKQNVACSADPQFAARAGELASLHRASMGSIRLPIVCPSPPAGPAAPSPPGASCSPGQGLWGGCERLLAQRKVLVSGKAGGGEARCCSS